MFKIIFTKKVKQNLLDIISYISLDSPINGIKTINSILKTIYMLEEFPYLGKKVDEELREIVETNYKYKIVYSFDNKIITIFAVYKYQNSWK